MGQYHFTYSVQYEVLGTSTGQTKTFTNENIKKGRKNTEINTTEGKKGFRVGFLKNIYIFYSDERAHVAIVYQCKY